MCASERLPTRKLTPDDLVRGFTIQKNVMLPATLTTIPVTAVIARELIRQAEPWAGDLCMSDEERR